MTKTRGGREITELLISHLDWIDDAAGLSRSEVVLEPQRAYDALLRVSNQVAAMRQIIRQRLEPLLERNARNAAVAALPTRVTALEAEIAQLRAQLDGQTQMRLIHKVE